MRRVRGLGQGLQPLRLLGHAPAGSRAGGPASSRTTPSSTCACPRRPSGTDADPRSASPRYRSAASSEPPASSSAAATAASSASAARRPAGNPAISACTVASCPPRYRPGQWSASSRAASPQSRAAWACRIASTG